MSDAEKTLFGSLTGAVKQAASEIGQEMNRQGVQGKAELAHALFSGTAYVPYGRGQQVHLQEQSREREGMSR